MTALCVLKCAIALKNAHMQCTVSALTASQEGKKEKLKT